MRELGRRSGRSGGYRLVSEDYAFCCEACIGKIRGFGPSFAHFQLWLLEILLLFVLFLCAGAHDVDDGGWSDAMQVLLIGIPAPAMTDGRGLRPGISKRLVRPHYIRLAEG